MIDPLDKMKESQRTAVRGRLKVFLGMAAGVGKTYGMLTEARQIKERGVDIVVAHLEPHGRVDTEALAVGIEAVPPIKILHRGVELKELDLDGVLRRRPKVAVVDEYAHSNVPGSRHAKRWQDVEEILASGIDVLTTVNIQHLESLRDVVAQITGVFVQETIPDSAIDIADQIELIDLPPEQLVQRLKEGRVYAPEKVDQALQSFFKRGSLLALRELSLRHTAEKVDKDLLAVNDGRLPHQTWQAGHRVMVCLAPNRMAPRVVRSSKRLASSLHAELIAVSVEGSREGPDDRGGREHLEHALGLASSLGARVMTLAGDDVAAEIIACARQENVTTIVMGKPVKKRWKELIFGSVVESVIRKSGDIDVLVITGVEERASPIFRRKASAPPRWQGWGECLLALTVCTLVGRMTFVSEEHLSNVVMLFLTGNVIVALRNSRTESLAVSALSVLCVNFFFVQPHFTLAVSDLRYVFTFIVLMSVSVLLSGLTLKLRQSAQAVSQRERATAALYELSRKLVDSRKKTEMAETAAEKASQLLDLPVDVFVNSSGWPEKLAGSTSIVQLSDSERAVAQWTFAHGQPAGAGTDTLSGSEVMFLPLKSESSVLGALAIRFPDEKQLDGASLRMLEAIADQLSGALERAQLAKETNEAALKVEKERMRSDLLSSVSHDLKTPLAAIQGSASGILQHQSLPKEGRELAESIQVEAKRMTRLIENLLDMSRVQGAVHLNLDWQSISDLVENAIERTSSDFDAPVKFRQSGSALLARVDGVLMEQVFVNLLENASRHGGRSCQVTIEMMELGGSLVARVMNSGPHLLQGSEDAVFERFRKEGKGGIGLGLAICRAVLEAHGGSISAENLEVGVCFEMKLPREGAGG